MLIISTFDLPAPLCRVPPCRVETASSIFGIVKHKLVLHKKVPAYVFALITTLFLCEKDMVNFARKLSLKVPLCYLP